jgi:hypothetical protein
MSPSRSAVTLALAVMLATACGARANGGEDWRLEYRSRGFTLSSEIDRTVDVASDGRALRRDASWRFGATKELHCVRKWPVRAQLTAGELAAVNRLIRRFRAGDVPSPRRMTSDVPTESITVYDRANPRHALGRSEFDWDSASYDPDLAPVSRILERYHC